MHHIYCPEALKDLREWLLSLQGRRCSPPTHGLGRVEDFQTWNSRFIVISKCGTLIFQPPRSMLNIGHTHACTQSSQNDDVLVQYMVPWHIVNRLALNLFWWKPVQAQLLSPFPMTPLKLEPKCRFSSLKSPAFGSRHLTPQSHTDFT